MRARLWSNWGAMEWCYPASRAFNMEVAVAKKFAESSMDTIGSRIRHRCLDNRQFRVIPQFVASI